MTAATATAVSRQLSAEARAVMKRFPPRPVPGSWDATAADRFTVARRLLALPFLTEDSAGVRYWRKLTMMKTLDWLELHPGTTWQERWHATGTEPDGAADWRSRMLDELEAAGKLRPLNRKQHHGIGTGLIQLIAADVIRPGLPWLLTTASPVRIAEEMMRTRDPAGIGALKDLGKTATVGKSTFVPGVERAALIMAAKGGLAADVTPGDCIELLDACTRVFADGRRGNRHSPFFYELLSTAGFFPAGAPSTVRMISTKFAGPLTAEQMIGRYDLACQPVRDLLTDYLRERQPGIDHSTLNQLALTLGLRFWKDLETHHPGISSLHLPPDIAAGWKQRIKTRTVRTPDGGEQVITRETADNLLMTIRAFYLDLAQWALDD